MSENKEKSIGIKILSTFIPWNNDGIFELIRKFVFIFALVVLIISAIKIKSNFSTPKQETVEAPPPVTLTGDLRLDVEVVPDPEVEVPHEILPEYADWYATNTDMVGWVYVNDSVIDYPVLQCDDNSYYIDHNFNKNYTKEGAIFLDYKVKLTMTESPHNLILYGHNLIGGYGFASLTRYEDVEYYRQRPIINFDTLYEKGQYKVFAAIILNTEEQYGELFNFHTVRTFPNKNEFNNYIIDIMDRSYFYTDVDIEYGDTLLTLCTCIMNYGYVDTRWIVFARKLREGESAEVDVSKAVQNYSPLMFDAHYNIVGGSWGGRTWDMSLLKSYDETIDN